MSVVTHAEKVAKEVKAVAATKGRLMPLGTLIDNLWGMREQKRAASEVVAKIEAEISEAEEALLARMEREGTDKATGKKATVSVGTSVVGNVKDWDELWKYIFKNKFSHLLQRRLSEPAIRELFEQKGAVPGVEPFTKKKLNVRTVS